MSIKLTPRLMTAVPYIRGGRLVADIGTDHAYLPVYLVASGRAEVFPSVALVKGVVIRQKI